ncbi:hypothetical protein CO151_06670 [bacterium CG_4_9_14_3_um_filter_65_15]|nr:MAG: hypothetical protein CO151_06670 [bacterium CG_4_9_14_3_um_filter_65_15]
MRVFSSVCCILILLPTLALAADPSADKTSQAAQATGRDIDRSRPYVPVYHPELNITEATGPISIDAQLDDPGWKGAAVADNFAEHNPGDQIRPAVDTEVLVTYDQDNLYVAWICYDDPAAVRATFCERDDIFKDDYVILTLDTYAQNAMAYEISANPYGIQGDLLFSTGRGEDGSYDMIFESAGRITSYGYLIEMAIPFAELRFPQMEDQVWRMDFWRNRPRESRYQYSWAAYDRNESCWPCNWGTVRGAKGIKSSKGFDLLPSLVFHQSGSRDDAGEWVNDPIEMNPFAKERNLDLGLGISYDISSELTAEATINPDFSQVESDAAQIDVNTTFALFYPERRPFFQEGSDLFDTYFNSVYTRSINDPIAAAKVTGRKGHTSVAALTARDEHSVIILPFTERSEFVLNGKSTTNILRARREFGEQTFVGVVATDRRFQGGGSGTLAGVDGKLRLSANDAIEWQYLMSHTAEVNDPGLAPDWDAADTFDEGKYTRMLDGESFDGRGLYLSFERSTRHFYLDMDFWERSPTFRADVGFEPANDMRQGTVSSLYEFRFENETALVERIAPNVNLGRKWDFTGTRKDEWVNASLDFSLRKAQTQFGVDYLGSSELFQGIMFDGIYSVGGDLQSQPIAQLRWGCSFNYGHRIARHDLAMGRQTNWDFFTVIKPVSRLQLVSEIAHIRSEDESTGEELFRDFIARSVISYQGSRELSLRLILQYRDRDRVWEADPLLTYRINPLSTFFLGSTRDYRDLTESDPGGPGWRLTNRQYFMKLQYLFRT